MSSSGKASQAELLWLGFAGLWFISFILALGSAIIANGIWGVPLFQVVNSSLSVSLFFVYALMALTIIGIFFSTMGGNFKSTGELLIILVIYALLPFGAITAFALYAWLGHLKLDDAFVYTDFMKRVGSIFGFAASLFGAQSKQLISFFTIASPVVGTVAAVIAIARALKRAG